MLEIKQEREIKHDKIKPVAFNTYCFLDSQVNPENPEGFYQKVKEKDQPEVCDEFLLHEKTIKSYREM